MPLTPFAITTPHAGLKFSKSFGHLFRPIYVDKAGTVLLWDREFTGILRLSPVLGRFLADVEFSERGDEVIFSRFEGGKDVLTGTLGLDQGVGLPRGLYLQLRKAESDYKRLGDSGALTERQGEFVRAFSLPDPLEFPAAYRVRKAGVFSRKKLYVLWGMVPEGPRKQPTIRMGAACVPETFQEDGHDGSSDNGGHAESVPLDASSDLRKTNYDEGSEWPRWLHLLFWLLGFLLLLAMLWFLFSPLRSCKESDSSKSTAEHRAKHSDYIPPIEKRVPLLQRRIDEMRKEPDSQALRERIEANKAAIKKQELAIDAADAHQRADKAAESARRKADESNNIDDRAEAERLRMKADALKSDSDAARRKADDSFRAPQEAKRLDDLKYDPPEEQKKWKSKFYVMPKNSSDEGEIMVRRFMPDEIVPKRGLRLHLEADANGRRDFRVIGWRLGIGPLIEKDRFEEFVPVGPELDVDVPLDLSFEYRGHDGEMHKDTAPFTLRGGIEIIPRIEIERYKENPDIPDSRPAPEKKADPRLGA